MVKMTKNLSQNWGRTLYFQKAIGSKPWQAARIDECQCEFTGLQFVTSLDMAICSAT